MAVVQVAHVQMRVHQSFVSVSMGMWLADRDARQMIVLMMVVVHVRVLVHERLVDVDVLVPLPEQQHHAAAHNDSGDDISGR
jgi:hypothetical protein